MNRYNKILLVAVLVVFVAFGGFAVLRKSTKSVMHGPVATQPTKAPTLQGTLASLLATKTPQQCGYSTTMQKTAVTGTVYITNQKMRGDFVSKGDNITVNGHMLVLDNTSYIWTDVSNQGMKMDLASTQATSSSTGQTPNLNQAVTYTCKPWVLDTSKFVLPKDITFTAFATASGAVMPSGTKVSGSPAISGTNPQSYCSACNSLPAAQQASCRAQLHCQ